MELLGALAGGGEDKDGGHQALGQHLPQGHEAAGIAPHEVQSLLHIRGGCVPGPHQDAQRVLHHPPRQLLHALWQGRAEQRQHLHGVPACVTQPTAPPGISLVVALEGCWATHSTEGGGGMGRG